MKKCLVWLGLLLSHLSLAESFDLLQHVNAARASGDAVKFKCIEADGSYDFFQFYGHDEMRWARYEKNAVVMSTWAKPRITSTGFTLHLEEAFAGAQQRSYQWVATEGNAMTWQMGGEKTCQTTAF
ncbi:hypothetical protein [Marinicella meishanensis]|uniref:hypothetical protein n=1 Tax=Marinicella meishanensis TaxID=2873263 RepID=UPI001CC168E5|nr:hypothetical protein [Marinicella sp. NBU2979]